MSQRARRRPDRATGRAQSGRSRGGPALRTSRPGGLAWAMDGGVAGPGVEPLAFARCGDPSAPRVALGYGPYSLRELRESEFGRLAGETGARVLE